MPDELLPIPELIPAQTWTTGRYRIAMIINDVVYQVMTVEPVEAAKYLSNPTFIQIPKHLYVETGFKYDGSNFTEPV
jgi:hypothetical protein